GDEARVHGARQHGDDDVERRLVGDAQAIDLPLLEAGDLQRRVDLFAPAVHDRHRRAARRDRRDRADDRRQMRAILEQLAAELQYETAGQHHLSLTTKDTMDTKDLFPWCPLCPLW